jgi:TonB family protein
MHHPLVVSLAAFALVSLRPFVAAQEPSVQVVFPAITASKADADVTTPRVLDAPDPEYPPSARAAGHQGTSVLSLMVGIDGRPYDIKVVRRVDTELDDSAITAASTWRYEPARKGNTPVEVQTKARIRFRLYDANNRSVAVLWDRSDANDAKADLELSKDYFQGIGVPQDEELGLQFLKMAADWNLPQAQFLMGEYFYKNASGSPDYVNAYLWYALSKRSGGKQGEEMLHTLASQMTAKQLGEAETRIGYWPENPPPPGPQ